MTLVYEKKSKNPTHIKIPVWGHVGTNMQEPNFYLDEDTMREVFEEHIRQIKKTGWIIKNSKGVYKGGVYTGGDIDPDNEEEIIRGAI